MSLLHINVEQLRATAWQLSRLAEEIDWQVRQMDVTRQELQSNWQGDGRFQFQVEMDNCLHKLRQLSHEISEMSLRLRREVAKWESVEQRF